jgi:hypothetical protein
MGSSPVFFSLVPSSRASSWGKRQRTPSSEIGWGSIVFAVLNLDVANLCLTYGIVEI